MGTYLQVEHYKLQRCRVFSWFLILYTQTNIRVLWRAYEVLILYLTLASRPILIRFHPKFYIHLNSSCQVCLFLFIVSCGSHSRFFFLEFGVLIPSVKADHPSMPFLSHRLGNCPIALEVQLHVVAWPVWQSKKRPYPPDHSLHT